jgi:hypothetical protein
MGTLEKRKAANAGERAAFGAAVTKHNKRDAIAIRSRLKALLVRLAVWGLIPPALTSWLIQRGGLRHA